MRLRDWINPDYTIGSFKQDDMLERFLDVEIVDHFSYTDACEGGGEWKSPPFEHANIRSWIVLANGYAVGFNENPSTGWSYPVRRYPPKETIEELAEAHVCRHGKYLNGAIGNRQAQYVVFYNGKRLRSPCTGTLANMVAEEMRRERDSK